MLSNDHSTFGGSTVKRWQRCPGSVHLLQELPDYSPVSPWAEEGTRAHEVAERILEGWQPPNTIDANMIKYGKEYAAGIEGYKGLYEATTVDAEVKLASKKYPDVGGTIDALILAPQTNTIIVVDYKYGAGVDVDVTENDQLIFYAGLALETYFPDTPFDGTVILAIFQPRSQYGGWKDWTTTAHHIRTRFNEMYNAVERVKTGDVATEAGDWCRWCEAQPVCPAFKARYVDPLLPRTPVETLSRKEIHEIFKNADKLTGYLNSMAAYIKFQCQAFGSFESFTIAQGKGKTTWLNEVQIQSTFTPDEYPAMYETRLKTPKKVLEAYPELKKKLEGQHTQVTYDKLISVTPTIQRNTDNAD